MAIHISKFTNNINTNRHSPFCYKTNNFKSLQLRDFWITIYTIHFLFHTNYTFCLYRLWAMISVLTRMLPSTSQIANLHWRVTKKPTRKELISLKECLKHSQRRNKLCLLMTDWILLFFMNHIMGVKSMYLYVKSPCLRL